MNCAEYLFFTDLLVMKSVSMKDFVRYLKFVWRECEIEVLGEFEWSLNKINEHVSFKYMTM